MRCDPGRPRGLARPPTTVVIPARRVKDAAKRRIVARAAWERNARTEVVTYALDERNRLVATIRHPAVHLDPAELDLYVNALAAGAERFARVLGE